MDDQSHVSLERRICAVCGLPFDTGAILLDRRLLRSMKHHTTTGWGLCPTDQQMFDKGFVALVECDPQRSDLQSGTTTLRQEQAHRTGRLAHIRRDLFARLFNVAIADNEPCVFIGPEVMEVLQEMVPPPA